MALFGHVMTNIMEHGDSSRLETAKMVRDAGELLTISEIEATKRYWHVWSSKTHKNTYPKAYAQPVVGMLYETMASFQTWFSPLPLVSYGIQLMPFTAVGELRDDPEWASILYPIYKESCEAAADFCTENGWNIIQAGLCATAGNLEEALDQALLLSEDAFNSDGGSGNSLSNTIWYIATRPK
jgi:endoglucanase Acf2